MTTEIENLVKRWNETRLRLDTLRKEQNMIQEQHDQMSKKVLEYLRENPKKHLQIGSTRIFPKEVNHYPNISQRFVKKAMEDLGILTDGEKLWKRVMAYREMKVSKVMELHTKKMGS